MAPKPCLYTEIVTVKTNSPTTITQVYIYSPPCSFFDYLLPLETFLPFIPFLHYFIYSPDCYNKEKLKNVLVWRSCSLNKERNITNKPVINVWIILFSNYFYHLVSFTKIYHFSLSLSLSLSIYIYIYKEVYFTKITPRKWMKLLILIALG